MALVRADRVRETTTTTGTDSISLLGQATGYRAFSSVMADGDTCYYTIVSQTGTEWETGIGTFSSPATLARTTVQSSSNSGSAVSFSAGTKDVFISLTASQLAAIGTVSSVTGTGTVNGITLTGNVTSSGNLTLGGALSGVNLGSQVTGTLSVSNGGTGTSNGSITGTGELVFAAGGTNQNITLNPSGTGTVLIDGITVGEVGHTTNPSLALGNGALASANSGASFPVARAIAIGKSALGNLASQLGGSSDGIVAIGENTIGNLATIVLSGQVAIGSNALFKGGQSCVAIGARAGYEGGSGLVAVGHYASSQGAGPNVVSIGATAGLYQADGVTYLTASEESVYIGYYSRGFDNNDSNSIVIGSRAIGKGKNSTVIGTTSTNAAWIYGNTLNLGNGASAATITANGALTVTAGGSNQDVTLTPSGTGKVNAPAIKETVFTITDGSSVDINPANGGIQVWTLGANRTPTASSFAEGQSVTLMVDDGTAYAITWSSISPTWVGGSAPTLATSGFTVIELWKRSSTIYGALVGTV